MSAPTQLLLHELIKLRIDIARAIENPPPRQKFIVGHLPYEHGVFGLVIGPDGSRKSWLVMHIAISVAGGRPVAVGPGGTSLWEAPERGRVVYLASEDSANVLARRLFSLSQLPGYEWVKDIDEYLDIIPTYSSLTLLSLDADGKPAKTQEYQAFLDYAKDARLIIIDPLADFFDISESDDRAARGVVQLLREMSRATGAGIVGVHHQNKIGMMSGETNHQSGRGSSRFGAGCRWAVVLQPMSEKNCPGFNEIEDPKDWTRIDESKATYAEEMAGESWLRRFTIEEDGRIIASAPAAAILNGTGATENLPDIHNEIAERKAAKRRKKNGEKHGEPDEHEMGAAGGINDWT